MFTKIEGQLFFGTELGLTVDKISKFSNFNSVIETSVIRLFRAQIFTEIEAFFSIETNSSLMGGSVAVLSI